MRNIALFFLLSIPVLSCMKREPPKQIEPSPVSEPNPVAEVTAFKGGVRTFSNGEWSAAVIGRILLSDDSLDVPAKSTCDLKDATSQTVKIAQAQKDVVSVMLEQGKRTRAPRPPVKMLSSVKNMAAKPQFQVTTPTAVAGVRGAKGRQQFPDTTRRDSTARK